MDNDYGLGNLGTQSGLGMLGPTWSTTTVSSYTYYPIGGSYLRTTFEGRSWMLEKVEARWTWVEVLEQDDDITGM